jgi:hypothetical protein
MNGYPTSLQLAATARTANDHPGAQVLFLTANAANLSRTWALWRKLLPLRKHSNRWHSTKFPNGSTVRFKTI